MKKFIFLALVSFSVCCNTDAQPMPVIPASQAEVNAGVVHNKFVAPDTAQAGAASIVRMSPAGGNNEYIDMRATSNVLNRQALGVSYGGDPRQAAWLWSAKGQGFGSNVWGGQFNFPGGIHTIGNRYWQDLPQSPFDGNSGLDVLIGYGPFNSSKGAAYANGLTNGPSQPQVSFIYGNPWMGAATIDVRGAYTNSAQGTLAGTDSNGIPIYVAQYGFQFGQISDAYSVPDGGVLTQRGSDCQQVPCNLLGLSSQYLNDEYISLNGTRSGDALTGQVPLFAITTSNTVDGDIYAGFPKQVPNVWMTKQPGWLWSLVVDEKTGSCTISNGSLVLGSNLLANATSANSYTFGRAFDIAAMFNVNGPCDFNIPSTGYGNVGAFTFDAATSHRMGFITQSGFYPQMAHAAGAPFTIAQYGISDLQSVVQGTTSTNEITINANSSVTFGKNIILNTVTTMPAVMTGNDGSLVNSNKVLYWMTSTKTNLISDGR